jgi:hypothetical protein
MDGGKTAGIRNIRTSNRGIRSFSQRFVFLCTANSKSFRAPRTFFLLCGSNAKIIPYLSSPGAERQVLLWWLYPAVPSV